MYNRKNNKNKKRRFVTLIEMMIVMFLIALITGVVAYNYTGSMEKGKAISTELGIKKLESILSIALAENPNADLNQWQELVKRSPLVPPGDGANAIIKDGWGAEYQVSFNADTNTIQVHSANLDKYRSQNAKR